MANMNDYLSWRGDLTLGERPFNDVDALVLACLSYLDLRGLVPGEDAAGVTGPSPTRPSPSTASPVSIREACEGFLARYGVEGTSAHVMSLATLDATFVRLLGESERFGPFLLHDYTDVIDEGRSLQFAAVQVDLPGGGVYVSYRGTDLSLVGWHEDFMLSFTVAQAQILAQGYLSRALGRSAKGAQVYVGGHSKGGNLATYAAATLPDGQASRLTRVYSFDGPGMARELLPRGAHDVLGERFVRIQPNFSVVGQIFDRGEEPRTYVQSGADGLEQHDPTSWMLSRDGFVVAESLAPNAAVLGQAMDLWLEGVDLGERAEFTDELFSILSAGGATTLEEVAGSPQGLQKVLSAARSASEGTKNVVGRLVEATVTQSAAAAREGAVGFVREGAAGLVRSVVSRSRGH